MPTEENIPIGSIIAPPHSPERAAVKKAGPTQPLSTNRFDPSVLPENFAHDLNNCVAVINGYSEVCLAYLNENFTDEKLLKYLNAIHAAGRQAADFTRQLLVMSSKKDPVPASLSSNGFPSGDESILIVEDEAVLRDLLNTVLGQRGYKITLAGNGEQATKIFSNSPKAFDVVLLDLQLPDTSGLVVLNRIRQTTPGQKVIAVSGCTDAETETVLARLGVHDYLLKPYHLNELGRALRTAMA